MADGSHNHVLSMFNILYIRHKPPVFGFDCLGDPAHPDLSFILCWIGVTVALAAGLHACMHVCHCYY